MNRAVIGDVWQVGKAMAPATRRLRLLQAYAIAVVLVVSAFYSLPPRSYLQDLHQDYLAARALRDGVDLFTPLNELAARYFPGATTYLAHPTAHPPVVIGASIPLTFLPYEVVAPLWLTCNVAVLALVGRGLGFSLLGSLALAAWPPVWWILMMGQWELFLLLMAMAAWRAAAAGRLWAAGMWLGLAAAVKLYPALLLVPFAVRRQFPVVLAAGALFTGLQLASIPLVGLDRIVHYYGVILPEVSAVFAGYGLNISPYSSLLRVFGGAKGIEPLVNAPELALPLAVAIGALGLFALIRLPPEGAPLAILTALPLALEHYIVMALPQILLVLRHPDVRRLALVATVAGSFAPMVVLAVLQISVFVMDWSGTRAPGVMALITAVPTAGGLGLVLLCLRLPRGRSSGLSN